MAGLRRYFNFEHPTFECYVLETIDSIFSTSRRLILAGAIHQHGPKLVRRGLARWIHPLGLQILEFSVKSWPVVELIFNQLFWRHRGGVITFVNSPESPPCVKPALEDCVSWMIVISAFLLGKYVSIPLRKIHPLAPVMVTSAFTIYHFCEIMFPNSSTTRLLTEAITRFAIVPARQDLHRRRSFLSRSFLDSEPKHPLYQYQALGSDHSTRLIRLAIDPVKSNKIQCSLIEVDINDPPPYRALSYCWGSSVKGHSIILTHGADAGTMIPITKSAFDALIDLTPLEQSCYLWIDAICIDQTSIPEKNLQIPLMSKIYGTAKEVVVHLGTSPDAALAATFISRIYFHEQLKNNSEVTALLAEDKYDPGALLGNSVLSFRHDRLSLQAWIAFQGNSYWSRAWVIQECVVAKRIVAIYSGVYIAWSLIMFSAGMLSEVAPIRIRVQDESLSEVATDLASPGLQMMMKLMGLRLEYAQNGRSHSLVEVVTEYRNSKATEGQDKVFALLGLSKDLETFPLTPDYSKNVQEVFGCVVKHALESGQFLSFCVSGLASREGGQSLIPLSTTTPSWMPDLVNPSITDTKRYHERGYTASGETKANFELSPQWDVLKIRGVHVDTVVVKSSSSHLKDQDLIDVSGTPARGLEGVLRLLEVRSLFDKHITSDDLDKVERRFAFWSAVTDDFDGGTFNDEEHLVQVLENLENTLIAISSMLEDNSLVSKELCDHQQNPKDQVQKLVASLAESAGIPLSEYNISSITPMLKANAGNEILEPFTQDVMIMAFHSVMTSVLAITEKKRVALVPQEAEVNDIIVVPEGSPVPHVLRPLGSSNASYQFVGEAYVHGCMHGEAMKPDQSWFSLR